MRGSCGRRPPGLVGCAACVAALCSLAPCTSSLAQSDSDALRPIPRDVALRPHPADTPSGAASTPPATALQPGIGFGFSVGVSRFGGDAHRGVGGGTSVDASFRYGTRFGLFLHVGAEYGGNPIDSVDLSLTHFSVYVEPRFVFANVATRWAPFVGGRLAFTAEKAEDMRARFAASGYSIGAGGGILYRLGRQLSIEGGVGVGVGKLGDYALTGDAYSYDCVTALGYGTPLSESVRRCADVPGAGAVTTCYAPVYSDTRASGVCDPPVVPQPGTGRSSPQYRAWLGFQLSFRPF